MWPFTDQNSQLDFVSILWHHHYSSASEILANETTSSGTQEISSDGSINLVASIVPTIPMPMLHWLKENDTMITATNPSRFKSELLDTGKYILLNSSDNGTVRYYKPEVNSSDSGTYVAMATYGGYYQIITTVAITVDPFFWHFKARLYLIITNILVDYELALLF